MILGNHSWLTLISRSSLRIGDGLGVQHDCVDLFEISNGKEVYWVLLLQPVPEQLDTFRRVGIGLVYPLAYKSIQKIYQTFYIV